MEHQGSSARPRTRGRASVRALGALLVSLAANAFALLLLSRAGAFDLPSRRAVAGVAISILSPALWDANRAVAAAAPSVAPALPAAAPAVRPEPSHPERDDAGPVIRVAPSPDQRPPAHAWFRADRDNDVAHDVQSREAGKRDWASLARRADPAPAPQGIPLPGEEGRSDTSAPGKEGAAPSPSDAPTDGARDVARARLALAPRAADDAIAAGDLADQAPADGPRGANERAEIRVAAGDGGARRSGRFDPRLLPTAATFERLSGGPGPRLPGVEEGDATSVATRRFRYADFHLRVKESVVREWDPNRVFDARDPDSLRYGRSTRGTTVDIVLEPSGAIHEVRVVRSSGLDFYDRELVRAIHAAAPFPNPPRGLVGRDGLIALRGWRFDLAWNDALLPPGGLTGGMRPVARP